MLASHSTSLPESLISYVHSDGIAIDCGLTTTRIVAVIDSNEPQCLDSTSLRFFKVRNDELKFILEEIRGIIDTKNLSNIFVTGFKKNWAKTILESLFVVNVIMVEEKLAMTKGFKLVSSHLDLANVEFKGENLSSLPEKYKMDPNNQMVAKMRKAMKFESTDDITTDENKISVPSILIMAGSFVRFFRVNMDKSIENIDTMIYGSTGLKGLAKCLCDLNNYTDIVEMANRGNRENVDTQVWEMFSENEKSPYGILPPDAPIFPFGKSADYNMDKEDFSQDDLMESLCNLVFNNILSPSISLCRRYKTRRLYICGTLFHAPIFAKLLYYQSRRFSTEISCKMLDCDYMVALGMLKL